MGRGPEDGEGRLLGALSEIVAAVNRAPDLDRFRSALMEVLPRVIPAAIVAYNEISFEGRPLITLAAPEPDPGLYTVWERVGHQNPLVQHHLRTRDGGARRMSDVTTAEELHATDFYREVLVPMGVEHQLAITLPAPPELLIGVVLSDAHDFTDAERDLLDVARPHIIQAHANAGLRERLRDVVGALAAGHEDTGEAVVVAGPEGRVRYASSAGAEALVRLGGSRDRVPDALVSRTDGRIETGAEVVRKLTADERTVVLTFTRGPRAVSLGLLAALGLSARQAQVLQAMMQGRSTAEIGASLGISPRTVHKHAQLIYGALGAGDRLGAVAAAWAALDATHM